MLNNITPSQRLRALHKGSRSAKQGIVLDRIERRICTEQCARHGGVSPCWSMHTNREDAQEWPNLDCPHGCHALAQAVHDELF